MTSSELTFNLLNFAHPSGAMTFWFSAKEQDGVYRLHRSVVPLQVVAALGEQTNYYTSFDVPLEGGLRIERRSPPLYRRTDRVQPGVNFGGEAKSYWSLSLLKRYYNFVIHRWFESKGYMVKPNFVADTEVWVDSEHRVQDRLYRYYEKYTVKVQFAKVTALPEIMLSYEGCSKQFLDPLDVMQHKVAPENFRWVIYRNRLFRLEELPDEGRRAYHEVFAVWNFGIRRALGQPTEAPERGNRYLKYKERVSSFYHRHMVDRGFCSILPLDGKGFVRVDPALVGQVPKGCNRLVFGRRKEHYGRDFSPITGLKEHGPYALSPFTRIHLFFIFHKSDVEKAKYVEDFFRGKKPGFIGLQQYVHINYYVESGFSIVFGNREDPLPEVSTALRGKPFKEEVRYIAVYLSPISKMAGSERQKAIYYRLKELLLKYRIVSQVLDAEKIQNPKVQYHYSLPNIAIAMLAKLNGTPWQLDTPQRQELVVGVGAYRHMGSKVQYIGSAFSFQNNGKFDRFDCFRRDEVAELTGSILSAVKTYIRDARQLDRLVIHYFKPIRNDELQPIERGLKNLGLSIPVYVIAINKTESGDIVAFDNAFEQAIPSSGTYVEVGPSQYLLFNNSRYEDEPVKEHAGFPFPVKLSISCSMADTVSDKEVTGELLEQVYQFSRVYWKSLSQQNLPVTIKYPEMVAGMFPYFDGYEIPSFGRSTLWFL